MAIYWLGRLADIGITEELADLICNENEQRREIYRNTDLLTTRYEISDFEGVYFQLVSQAVMALVRIGDAHSNQRELIAKAFEKAFGDGRYYERITKRPKESSEGSMVLTIGDVAFSATKKWFGNN